ncbi:MAG TPA: PTS sugar transporter subunit IIB [Anaeromyxobacteraceae bacterium]|nr:PTS sugar transporter subunit IIB [Anaeromyxobacteraceae bacterium]
MIALVRVDNRLLHGQILEAWIPRLGIGDIVVADDEAASSHLARAALMLCVPQGMPARIVAPGDVPWEELAGERAASLVLVRDVGALATARCSGLTPERVRRINVGNVHFAPGRRPVTPSVFLAADEVSALRALADAGFEVEARAIPSETPVGMGEIERRYAAAP